MKKLTLAALALVAVAPLTAADWSDTFIAYRTGNKFQEPANDQSMKKDVFSLGHVSGYSLGGNFFSVDMLKSEKIDPANGAGSNGAQEVYVAYRHNLNLSKVFKTKIDFGPVRGIDFTAGFDYNTKNTAFAPSVFKIMAGPTFNFKVPGFLNVGILYYNEKNHNAFGSTKNVSFDPTYQIAGAWGINVPLGKVDTKITGFGTYTGSKGKDGAQVETKPETLIRAYWMFDASPVFGVRKGAIQIGPGVEYWDNKFGDPTFESWSEAAAAGAGRVVNPKTTCFMVNVEFHF